jgi:hypothetical protein
MAKAFILVYSSALDNGYHQDMGLDLLRHRFY